MIRNEVTVDEELCHGCGYCVQFCPRGCLEMPGEQPGPMYSGYEIAKFAHTERCTGCGICSRMCPCGAIEVYVSIEEPARAVIKEKVAGIPRLLSCVGFGDCVGCQKATVGCMITEVLDELGLGGRFIGLDAVRCNSSSAFGEDFHITIEREDKPVRLRGVRTDGISTIDLYDDPIPRALELKRAHPDAVVFVVQDSTKLDAIGMDSFDNGLMRGGNITVIDCHELIYRGDPGKGQIAPPASPVNNPERRNLIMGKDPLHLAERAAALGGVSYSARGAITSPDDYERTKRYIKTAFQKQMRNPGTSFVEVLCACFAQAYESPWDTLKWIHEKVVAELPLLEFKNEDQMNRASECSQREV